MYTTAQSPAPAEEQYLSSTQVCRLFGWSKATLDRYRRRPDFPRPIVLNARSLRWRKSQLLAWMEGLAQA